MQAPNWTDFLQCSVCTNKYDSTQVVPVSLSCGHTLCTKCLGKLKTRVCPYDKTAISPNAETLPPNSALLQLLGHKPNSGSNKELSYLNLSEGEQEQYEISRKAIEELALFLQPLAEQGLTSVVNHLTRPMLKKLVTVVNCQVLEIEGRARALRAARSIADRTVTELLVLHQNQQQISTLLWTAVRNRGCQFLGPVMQEEALKLILKVLESGKFLSRKTIVLYVVQQLQQDFPQASKTCVGHVVQLLYRASCFNVEKREDESSLMQLKEEFRASESLRREHDSQIIRVAMEAGLRISPEQWSTLLYGDHKHKSDMQSIIDKLIAQGAASSGLSELIVAIGRSQDPWDLSEKIIPHLEVLLKVDINVDKNSELVASWQFFAESMQALLATLQGFTTFMHIQSGRYKTGMCPSLEKPEGCPKGEKCTYAHSEEERDRYRSLARGSKKPLALSTKPLPSSVSFNPKGIPPGPGSTSKPLRTSGELATINLDGTSYYKGSVYGNHIPGYPSVRDSYPGSEPYDPTTAPPLRYSYTSADRKVYSGPQASLVSYTPDPHPVHHSGPIAVYEGNRHMAADIQYYSSSRSGPLPEEVTYSQTTPYPYKVPQYSPQNSMDMSYIRIEEGHPRYNPPAPNPAPAGHSGMRMTPSEADSLANLRRMRETVKKSLQSSEPPPIMSDRGGEGRGELLGYVSPTAVPGHRVSSPPETTSSYSVHMDGTIPNRASFSSVTSLPDGQRYVDSTGQPVRPPSLHQLHSTDSGVLSLSDVATTASSLPVTAPEDVRASSYYPASSSAGYTYGGISGEPEAVAYDLQTRMSELSVSSDSGLTTTFDPVTSGYSTSSNVPRTTYGSSSMSNPHSMPPPASYSTSTPASTSVYSGSEYRQPANGRSSSRIHGDSSGGMAGGHSGQISTEEEHLLREQVKFLQQQLHEKQATIAELQQPHTSRMPVHHTSPGHSGMLGYAGGQSSSSHHSGPIAHHSSFSGPVPVPVHYSPHNTAQQFSVYPTTHIQGSGGSYYTAPQPSPGGTYHQWSGPLSGSYTGTLNPADISPTGSLQTGGLHGNLGSLHTPPGTGLIVHPSGNTYMVQPQATLTLPQDSDASLAHYLQVMEQQRASQFNSTAAAMAYGRHPERYVPVAAATAYTLEPAAQSYVYHKYHAYS